MKRKTCIFAMLLATGLINSHAQDTWTQKANFGGTARNKAAGFSIGSTGYIGTGDDGILKKDFWEYDPATNAWVQKANFSGTGRANAAGFSIGSTGYIGDGYNGTYINEFWAYDSTTNVWTQKPSVGTPRQYEVGFSIGSKGYIGTGYDGIAPYTKDFWEYDPSTNTWTRKADFGGTARNWAVGFPIGNKGYIGTGYDLSGVTKDFWEYDPVTDTWTQKADFGGTARGRAVGFSIGSKGYIGTGADSADGLLNDFWEYTPATAQTNPVPLISQPLVPDAIAPGGAAFPLTVNGTGFVSGSVVNWNGSARATTFVSTSQLTVSILASDIAIASTASVTVVNPSPGGGASNVEFFPITFASSSITFSRSDFALSPGPAGVAAGDFNGDGKLDLAVANYASNTVSILLGNGDGTFQTHVDYATGAAPDSPLVGDFNGDGLLDLVVRSQNSNQVSLLLGNGDGTFQTVANFAAGSGDGSLAVGDLNGDGKLDLVSTSSGENMVYILLGKGNGRFERAVAYPTGSSWPYGIAVGDLNGDGKLDLAISDLFGDAVSILLGNGDGTFQPHVDYATGTGPNWINVADLNADGALDLVVPNAFSNTVSILLGNGNGTFQPHVDYPAGSAGRSSVADFNGDGKVDLAVTASPGEVFLLLGNGDGTFQLPTSYATGAGGVAAAVGDFNGDGKLDLGATNINDNSISILLQTPTTSYRDVILADNPIMYWRLGETSGTIAYDESANHRDASYINNPSLGFPGAIANDTNTSAGFDGFNQGVRWIPTSRYRGSFTVEAWVNEKKVRSIETFFNTRAPTSDFSFDFKFDKLAGKEIRFDIGDGTKWLSTSALPFNFQRHVWYYVAAVVTTNGATYYVDGSALGSVTYNGTPLLFDAVHKVEIGFDTGLRMEGFDGAIDEVAVYDYALTADQIAAHYATGTGN